MYWSVFKGSVLTAQKSIVTKLSKKELVEKDMGWLSSSKEKLK